jgi:putative isomerase
MATLLGKPKTEVDGWWRKSNRTAELMQQRLYDAKTGLFLDYNSKTNLSVNVVTPATFFALLPGVATQAQAVRMAAQLTNHSSLASPFPLPVVSQSNPAYAPDLYWRGPTWININFLTAAGLERYGLAAEASKLRRQTLALVARGDVLRKYYNSQNGSGLGAENFMWTGALYVAMALGA